MLKPLRTVAAALFMMSMFCLASCNRNWCYNSPCEVNCAPNCGPCPQKCGPCQPTCQPSCNIQRTSQPCAQPCAPESNPYYPCDPSFFPCGSGQCGAVESLESQCYNNMTTYRTCDDCVVELCQVAPEFATVGSPYPIEINITARKECADVVVNQTLPMDADFIRSEPAATPDANKQLRWEFHHMTCGETQQIRVWVKPQKEGCCLAAATVCACPQLCAYTRCGQPVVCIKKCGPACACLYCPLTYRIEVCNSGSATAYDVVVQDAVPDGLSHSTGYGCLTYNLGNLAPGQSRVIDVDFCAVKRGTVTNTATVSFCGGPKCTAEATTIINEPCVQVNMTGPDWAYICKAVDYTITVTNPGDLVLRNVVVDDVSPAGTTISDAPGAEICCNRAVWTICELCPGETQTFNLTVRSQVTGNLTNKVSVTSQSDCGQCTMCAEAPTLWKGIAATHMCMVDTADPICIGDTTIYRICVTNRGTSDDTNVQLVVSFSSELQPQSANGPAQATINGNVVTFAPIERLAPKQSVEYLVTVKGVAVGDAKAEATMTSDMLGQPITDTEGTHVY